MNKIHQAHTVKLVHVAAREQHELRLTSTMNGNIEASNDVIYKNEHKFPDFTIPKEEIDALIDYLMQFSTKHAAVACEPLSFERGAFK